MTKIMNLKHDPLTENETIVSCSEAIVPFSCFVCAILQFGAALTGQVMMRIQISVGLIIKMTGPFT